MVKKNMKKKSKKKTTTCCSPYAKIIAVVLVLVAIAVLAFFLINSSDNNQDMSGKVVGGKLSTGGKPVVRCGLYSLSSTGSCYTDCTSDAQCASTAACGSDRQCHKCIDSDNGIDYEQKGTSSGVRYVNAGQHDQYDEEEDSCYKPDEVAEYYCAEVSGHKYLVWTSVECESGVCNDGVCVDTLPDFTVGTIYAIPNDDSQSIYVLINIENDGEDVGMINDYWVQIQSEYYVDPLDGTSTAVIGPGDFFFIEETFMLSSTTYTSLVSQGYIDIIVSLDSGDVTLESDETNNEVSQRVYFS